MAKDRARDIRRSVGSHEKMMGALGKAAGFRSVLGDNGEKYTGKPDGSAHFSPGHGHVATGTKDYYDHDRLATTDSGFQEATKGLEK
jgi:hypothetical protein